MKKSKIPIYNSGMLFVCQKKEKASDFGAAENTVKKCDLKILLKLMYAEMSKRDEDLEFAQSSGHSLSLKVKTKLHDGVSNSEQIIIGNVLYSIYKVDFDRQKNEMYLYIEEERKIK